MLPDPLPPADIKFSIKRNELQVDVISPSPNINNVDELYLHGYTDTSEPLVLEQVKWNSINYVYIDYSLKPLLFKANLVGFV